MFKFFFNLVSWLFLAAFLLIILFTVGSNSNLFGGYRSFLVLSGSMEPTINIGDLVIVHKQDQFIKNDVITFFVDSRIVTHRIIESIPQDGKSIFITRGDANRTEDDEKITNNEIIGKVVLVIPKLGYLVNFGKSTPGLIALILIPIAILVFDVIYNFLMSKYKNK